MRVYTDQPNELRALEREHPDVLFVCDIKRLPPPMNNIQKYNQKIWRFMPLFDPQVDIVNFRDSDSIVS